MKILHVNAGWGAAGGTESYLAGLVAAQSRGGKLCAVLAETIGEGPAGVPVVRVPGLTATDRAEPRAPERFAEAVREIGPDVIHLHNVTHPEIVERAPELAPSVSFVHDHTPFCPGLNKEYADGGLCDRPMGHYCLERYQGEGCLCLQTPDVGLVASRILRTRRLLRAHARLGGVVVASEYMRLELERAGVATELISVAPPYAAPRAGPPPSATGRRVAMIGRMVHPDKGVEPLLDALAAVSSPFEARLIGEGPHRARFEAYRDDKGLREAVAFLGGVPHSRVEAELDGSRLVVLPSMWNEPFGIVGLEAMARGRPVVAFDVGGVRQWLEPETTGLLVPRGDSAALAAAVERVLNDDDLADRLGLASLGSVAERFTERAHLEALDRVYEQASLLSKARPLRQGREG